MIEFYTKIMSRNIYRLRVQKGYSQERLAVDAGVSSGTVKKLERGGNIRIRTLIAASEALGCSPSDLFVDRGE